MNCEQIQPNLLDYSKGLLSGPEAREIAEHISHCAECAAVLEQEVEFAAELSRAPDVEPMNDVWALVRAQTKPRSLPVIGWLKGASTAVRRAVATTAVAAVVALSLIGYNMKPAPVTPVIAEKPPVTAVAVKWTDDPLRDRTDAMVASIDDL